MSKIHVKFLEENRRESEEQLVQLCLDELSEIGIPFPTNLRIGEREVLLRNDDIKITLWCTDVNIYRFFYCSYVNGHGTTFNSALFSAEPV